MRVTFSLIIAFVNLVCINQVFAASVATVTPIADSMSRALLADTPIKVVYLPPKRLPINRIPSWLNKNRTEPLSSFDAIVNISSMRPNLAFYTSVRSTNIHAVPIDIAEALLPGGERVAVQETNEYFWLNSNNTLLMLGILKRDLALLWPQYAEKITQQYQKVSNSLRQISLDIDDHLLGSGYEGIINANKKTEAFSKGLLLPTISKQEANTTESLHALTISTKKQSGQWVVDDFSRYSDTPFILRWQGILTNLHSLE